ncbi:Cox19-like CHCH family protein [Raphanus sativus]|uniref:Uncharacterized protein LOC108841120 n=1 Tax=Raphanus sativus TaxID=3726 RepID=A0A6J0MBF9_RAPSA|nr:uncharacterized protein LOC108841120 [Raphanus sativus]KAJ4909622.1 Cox19-like CHCH family protein [Raphanus sativus]
MGRRGYGGGGRRSYSTRPKVRSTSFFHKKAKPAKDEKDEKAPPPAKVSPKVETVHCESSRGSFFSSIADGFNWGAGNAMGHRFVESIFGPRTIKTEVVLPERVEVAAVSAIDDNDKYKDYNESCSISYNAFQECLNVEGNKLSKCHVFMDSLFECRKNSSSFNF